MPQERTQSLQVARTRCPFCHDTVLPGQPVEACVECHALHHDECWVEGGQSCGACQAQQVASATRQDTVPCSARGCDRESYQLDTSKPHCAKHEFLTAGWILAIGAFLTYLGFESHPLMFLLGVPLVLGALTGLKCASDELAAERAAEEQAGGEGGATEPQRRAREQKGKESLG